MRAMVSEATLKSLHPLEVKTLLHFDRATEFDAQNMEHEIGLKLGQCNQALSWLSAKACIDETRRDERVFYERTELGRWRRTT
jgi:phenylalanyl-tRNA synthetase alpha chain